MSEHDDTKPLLASDAPPPYTGIEAPHGPSQGAVPEYTYVAAYPPSAPAPAPAPAPNAGYPGSSSATAGAYPPQPQQSAYPVAYPSGYGTYQPVPTQPMMPQQPMMMPQQPVLTQPMATQPMGGQGQPVMVSMAVRFGELPMVMDCPVCQARITTKTERVNGNLTYLACGGLCLFGCWLCCCFPFCMDSMQDVVHRCPSCSSILGKYQRIK